MKPFKKQLSKLLSLALRHKPEILGLELNERGACKVEKVLKAIQKKMPFVKMDDILGLTKQSNPNDKIRFEINDGMIRAGHGHSIPIVEYIEVEPMAPLYHATSVSCIESIKSDGLLKMNREKVHLSFDIQITKEAALRRSKDIALIEVMVKEARENGVKFYETSDARIVISDNIPVEYLKFVG